MYVTLSELVKTLEKADTQEDIVKGFIGYLTSLPEHLLSKEILWDLSRAVSDILILKKELEVLPLKKERENNLIRYLNMCGNVSNTVRIIDKLPETDKAMLLKAERDDRMNSILCEALICFYLNEERISSRRKEL